MGRLDVHIRHGGGGDLDLAGLAVPVILAGVVLAVAEVIAAVIWWLVAIAAVLAVAVIAGAVVWHCASRRAGTRVAAQLAARRAVITAPPRPQLPPPGPAALHLHFHGTDEDMAVRVIRQALPGRWEERS